MFSSALPKNIRKLWLGYNAAKIPPALIQGIAWEQDYICRCLGKCLYGETLDEEIGTMMDTRLPSAPWLAIVHYEPVVQCRQSRGPCCKPTRNWGSSMR